MLVRIAHEKHAVIFLEPMQELADLSWQGSIRRECKAASVRPAAIHFASDARLRSDRPDSANPALRRRLLLKAMLDAVSLANAPWKRKKSLRNGRGVGPRRVSLAHGEGIPHEENPAQVRPEKLTEQPAPERMAILWSPWSQTRWRASRVAVWPHKRSKQASLI